VNGLRLDVDARELQRLSARLNELANLDYGSLLEGLGAEVESQTRRRIGQERTSPDGDPWVPWSERYARTRHAGQNLLQGEGDLLDSIAYQVGANEVEIGSPLIYAGVHQEGWEDIPAREHLGLSPENEADLAALIDDFIDAALGES
jgi:phage virion morphogenesis protein